MFNLWCHSLECVVPCCRCPCPFGPRPKPVYMSAQPALYSCLANKHMAARPGNRAAGRKQTLAHTTRYNPRAPFAFIPALSHNYKIPGTKQPNSPPPCYTTTTTHLETPPTNFPAPFPSLSLFNPPTTPPNRHLHPTHSQLLTCPLSLR